MAVVTTRVDLFACHFPQLSALVGLADCCGGHGCAKPAVGSIFVEGILLAGKAGMVWSFPATRTEALVTERLTAEISMRILVIRMLLVHLVARWTIEKVLQYSNMRVFNSRYLLHNRHFGIRNDEQEA